MPHMRLYSDSFDACMFVSLTLCTHFHWDGPSMITSDLPLMTGYRSHTTICLRPASSVHAAAKPFCRHLAPKLHVLLAGGLAI